MDDESAVLETFYRYIEAFKQLNPRALLPFYYYPALIIERSKKPKVLFHSVVGFIGFSALIKDLRQKGYAYSELHKLSAKQLSESIVIVSGTATRCREDKTAIETIGFTYTLRQTSKGWKIVVGIIHNVETFLTLPKLDFI